MWKLVPEVGKKIIHLYIWKTGYLIYYWLFLPASLVVHLRLFSPSILLLAFLPSLSAVPFVLLRPDPFCVLALSQALTRDTKNTQEAHGRARLN